MLENGKECWKYYVFTTGKVEHCQSIYTAHEHPQRREYCLYHPKGRPVKPLLFSKGKRALITATTQHKLKLQGCNPVVVIKSVIRSYDYNENNTPTAFNILIQDSNKHILSKKVKPQDLEYLSGDTL